MWTELEEYMASGDSEKMRSGCMNAKIWQSEIAAAIQDMGWNDGKKKTRFWLEKKKRVREGGQVLLELL